MVQAIEELQDAGVEPDVWKVEGLDRREDCEELVATARRGGRDKVGCIILGRGEDDAKCTNGSPRRPRSRGLSASPWAARASGILVAWRAKKITREDAVNEIVHRYRGFVDTFEGKA